LRKFLHRWLSAARTARRRRITLKEKEEEMNTMVLMHAWDKWRERFVKEKLRVMVSKDV
jgi:protein SFI1